MNLIQIGRTILNLDRVTWIRDLSTIDSSGQVVQSCYRVELESGQVVDIGHDAAALRQWLAENATVIATSSGVS